MDISQLRNFIRQHDQRTPVEWLREASIKVFFADLPSGAVRHRVYNSIDWSTRYQDRLYVFSSGIWLRVKQEYADQLDACISKIGTPTNKLPLAPTEVMQTQKGVANDNKGEGLYVNAVTANRFSFLKLHPSLLRSELMNEDVEPCDILGADGALYYIKRGGRSSGLSHLFSQGRAAALTLMRDAEYRRLFRGVICKVVDDAAADPDEAEWLKQEYASKFPEEGVDPKTIEVCFVVIRNSSDGWPINMPYLSKVSLYETYRHLSGAKFTVTIQCVTPEAPDPANTPTEQAATDKERADSARAQGAVSP